MTSTDPISSVEPLVSAIEKNQLALPSLPDVVVKIQHMIDDMNVSIDQVITAISGDPVIVAQLIKTANSAIFAGKPKADNVRAAISRIGFRSLRNLVMSITMSRLAQADHPIVKKYLTNFWLHSREVATYSYMLARSQKHLNPDQAMLAGLLHDIGTLPLCIYADKLVVPLNTETLELLLHKFRVRTGVRLLEVWHFPDEIIEVVAEHENLQRETGQKASYADIVTVANLLNRATGKVTPWKNISALARLDLAPEICWNFHERFSEEILATQGMLFSR